MSYTQAMQWERKHRKGTNQPIVMSTGSGFRPAIAWIDEDYVPYLEKCKLKGVTPLGMREYYDLTTKSIY